MPRELDFEAFEHELSTAFSPEQREWLAMLLHDHVSGLISNIAIQVDIVDRMLDRDMDIREEFASLKENVRAASEHLIDSDVVAGRLREIVPDWSAVFATSFGLSREFAARTLARSLDILHVAIAIVGRAELFVTGDRRQEAMARHAGLVTETLG